jgi:hypothetical protein
MMTSVLAVLGVILTTTANADWLPLRWQARNGPRDVEYSQPSVKVVAGVLSVSVRRDRAVLLKQDPTIAPETHPWTSMELQVDCPRLKWRVVNATALDASGKMAGYQSGGGWMAVQAGTMAEAVRARLCPTA